MTPIQRRMSFAVPLLLAALLAFLFWPEPKWTVSVEADELEPTPWQTVHVVAKVTPASAVKSPSRWKWQWSGDARAFTNNVPAVEWRSGKIGEHQIQLTVESPKGTKQTVTLALNVRYKSYLAQTGFNQDLSALPKDPAPADLPFGIADVWIEKDKVCAGEPTRIRVTPFDKRGEEKWLTPSVAGQQSWEATYVMPPTGPGPRLIPIGLVDNRATPRAVVYSYVYVEIKDCIAPFPLFLEYKTIPPHEEDVAFAAKVFDGPGWLKWTRQYVGAPKDQVFADGAGPPMAEPAVYLWDFGDGSKASTKAPQVNHHYPSEFDRPDERMTSYSVRLEAIDARGQSMATTYGNVQLTNLLHALKREHGTLQLIGEVPLGPAHKDPNGSRFVQVTLSNYDPTETARLKELKLRFVPCSGKEAAEKTIDLRSVFPSSAVTPRGSLYGRFAVDGKELDGICWVNAEVGGESEPGNLKVVGFFSLDTGQREGRTLPPKEQEVMDQVLEILGHPTVVSYEDIRRLEDEGKIPRGVLGPQKE
jgi:PKD domain-containing protein